MKEKNTAHTKVYKEGGGEGGLGTRTVQPVVKTMVTMVVPMLPMEVHGGSDISPLQLYLHNLSQKGSFYPVGFFLFLTSGTVGKIIEGCITGRFGI